MYNYLKSLKLKFDNIVLTHQSNIDKYKIIVKIPIQLFDDILYYCTIILKSLNQIFMILCNPPRNVDKYKIIVRIPIQRYDTP